jgi:hypothetical protein
MQTESLLYLDTFPPSKRRREVHALFCHSFHQVGWRILRHIIPFQGLSLICLSPSSSAKSRKVIRKKVVLPIRRGLHLIIRRICVRYDVIEVCVELRVHHPLVFDAHLPVLTEVHSRALPAGVGLAFNFEVDHASLILALGVAPLRGCLTVITLVLFPINEHA